MPSVQDLVQFMEQIPEVRALLFCARRCSVRVGIRGGVIRHVLFAYGSVSPDGLSLFDFVDSFSDVDLVIDKADDWQYLEQAISSSVPFAGFHRWEVERVQTIAEIATSYFLFPVDRLIVWIDGKSEHTPLYLDGVLTDPNAVLSQPSVDPDLRFPLNQRPSPVTGLLTLLRFARYYLQFPGFRDRFVPDLLKEQLYSRRAAMQMEDDNVQFTAMDLRRVELAILHLLFNAIDLAAALSFLGGLISDLPARWRDVSQIVRAISKETSMRQDLFIGAAVYRPGPSRSIRARLVSSENRPDPPGVRRPNSIIPWTRMSAFGGDNVDCCRYQDFNLGPAVIAWRKLAEGASRKMDIEIEDYGVVARRHSGSDADKYSLDQPQGSIPIPGFVRKGPSLVIRFDHDYVRQLFRRNVRFSVGLIKSILSDQDSQ